MKLLVLIILIASCARGEHRPARETYNTGVAALATGDFEAAEKALLEARSQAGVDPELRFRAAYDLGHAFAAHSEKVKTGQDADLAKALELAQQAAWWFGDAQRLRADHKDTIANLAIVRARVQAISDELRAGEGKLEARLDALIAQQREVLTEIRGAWRAIAEAGGGDPLAQQSTLTRLADRSRGIVAEAGVIGDLASDEIDVVGKKAEDKRSDEEKMRLVQLKNLDLYLIEARARIAETRRELQELSADTALSKSEAALVALKRAREQLFDPITILNMVLQDELDLERETQAAQSLAGDGGKLQLAPTPTTPKDPDPTKPAEIRVDKWLEYTALAGRQTGLRDRVDEVQARLTAAVEHDQAPAAGSGSGSAQPAPPKDPKQVKMMIRVRAALPSVIAAASAMGRARGALLEKQWQPARDAEAEALLALSDAIEQFADLKRVVDHAWRKHQYLMALLVKEPPAEAGPTPAMTSVERAKKVQDELGSNIARLDRIAGLIAEQVTELTAKAQELAAKAPPPEGNVAAGSAAGSGAGSAVDPEKQKLAAEQAQLESMKQTMTRAEELRARARTELAAITTALAGAKGSDPRTAATTADATLLELRKLFFDVLEHLQELIREQGETKERTGIAGGEDDFTREAKLPNLLERQDGHGTLAKAITDALAQQADAAAKAGSQPQQPGAPSPAEQAKSLSAAAAEVRLAQNDMSDAQAALTKAKTPTGQSVSLDPATKSQTTAIEHLQKALQLLQPPPKKSDKDQKKDDEKKEPEPKPEPKDEQQQGGPGQKARDEDAKRQKARQDQKSEPVDQDW